MYIYVSFHVFIRLFPCILGPFSCIYTFLFMYLYVSFPDWSKLSYMLCCAASCAAYHLYARLYTYIYIQVSFRVFIRLFSCMYRSFSMYLCVSFPERSKLSCLLCSCAAYHLYVRLCIYICIYRSLFMYLYVSFLVYAGLFSCIYASLFLTVLNCPACCVALPLVPHTTCIFVFIYIYIYTGLFSYICTSLFLIDLNCPACCVALTLVPHTTYVFVFIYIYIYIYRSLSCIYTSLFMYIQVSFHVSIRDDSCATYHLYICLFSCMYASLFVSFHVYVLYFSCMYPSLFMYIYLCFHLYTGLFSCIYTSLFLADFIFPASLLYVPVSQEVGLTSYLTIASIIFFFPPFLPPVFPLYLPVSQRAGNGKKRKRANQNVNDARVS